MFGESAEAGYGFDRRSVSVVKRSWLIAVCRRLVVITRIR